MAIGSDPEYGASFGLLRDFPSWEHLMAWHGAWRDVVGGDLLGGYATLVYVGDFTDERRSDAVVTYLDDKEADRG